MILEKSLAPAPETYYNDALGIWIPKYQAYEVGVVVARQNGKGSILEARELAGLLLLGEQMIVHSAHEFKTALEGFKRLVAWFENVDDLRKEVKKVIYNHGEEGIDLKNGQRFRISARTKGGLRGFTLDTLILDEAMILKEESVASTMYTLSARPNPQIWYTGSAGDEESHQFGRVRRRAHLALEHGPDSKFGDDRLLWCEWAANTCSEFCKDDCQVHDRIDDVQTWTKTNPGMGIRISPEHTAAEFRSSPREFFLRERLSVGTWPVSDETWLVIPEDHWSAREELSSVPKAPYVLAVDVTPSLSHSAIVACGQGFAGRHVEVTSTASDYDHRQGTDWVVPAILAMREKWKGEVKAVVIDKGTQAGRFVDELAYHGVEMLHPSAREYAQACGAFYTAVVPKEGNKPDLAHIGQPMLNKAVAGATQRHLSDLWAWDKKTARTDISPLVAGTLALWGHMKVTTEASSATPWAIWR